MASTANTSNTVGSTGSTGKHLYIGKIPAYNDAIQTKINYEERLKNNLTIATFSPVGYSISLGDKFAESLTGKSAGEKNETNNKKEAIFRVGGMVKGSIPKISKTSDNSSVTPNDTISTATALETWIEMQKTIGISDVIDNFSIISTNDSTINETISNEFAPNQINNASSLLGAVHSGLGRSAESIKKLATLVTQGFTSVNSQSMIGMLKKKDALTGDSQFSALLSANAIGIQTAIPKIWTKSDYNNTSSFTIKLISPSGHKDDIENYVINPLRTLVLAASPVTYDGVSYGFPPIWSVNAKGLLNCNLAAITAIVITRGGQDTIFNKDNIPTNIDVRLTVEPLVNGFATPLISTLKHTPDATTGEVNLLVASPKSLTDSMKADSNIAKSFALTALKL